MLNNPTPDKPTFNNPTGFNFKRSLIGLDEYLLYFADYQVFSVFSALSFLPTEVIHNICMQGGIYLS